jgi:hypothetical protein
MQSSQDYDMQGDAEDLFLPGSSRVPIQSPLTTRKGMRRKINVSWWVSFSSSDGQGMLRIFSYPGPHGSGRQGYLAYFFYVQLVFILTLLNDCIFYPHFDETNQKTGHDQTSHNCMLMHVEQWFSFKFYPCIKNDCYVAALIPWKRYLILPALFAHFDF